MQLGLATFPTDYSMNIAELGRIAEELGFESLFVPEHTHIPASRRTPYPGGTELPREYSHTLDPFAALSAVAAVTSRLKLGTGICLVIERDPIVLAKEVATVDLLSGGRFLFGIGGGWNLEEMENHGTNPDTRWKLLRERVLAMKALWTQDEAEFHGDFVSFDPVWSWPKPVQKPHPPVIVGGDGPHTLQRVVEYGDEWMPLPGRSRVPLDEKIARLQEMARAKGRGRIPITIFGARADPDTLERYAAHGVDRCLLMVPPVSQEQVVPVMQRYAELVRRFA